MGKRKILSSDVFIHAIKCANTELETQIKFVESAIEEPICLFRDGNKHLGRKSLVSHIMNGFLYENKKVSVHDFQVFLADVVNRFVQEWANKNGITESIEAKVRKESSYPSVFAIYHNDDELIQFDVFEKFYGVRKRIKDEETINREYKEFEDQLERTLEPLNEQLVNYQQMLDHVHQYIRRRYKNRNSQIVVVIGKGKSKKKTNWKKRIRNFYLEVIDHCGFVFKKKKYRRIVETRIHDLNTQIEVKKRIISQYPPIEETIKINLLKAALTKKLIPMFEEFNYRLETERSKLY